MENKFLVIRRRILIWFSVAIPLLLLVVYATSSALTVTEYTLEFDTLPKNFVGFKICHLSDVHATGNEEILEKVREQKPDIIAVTGDDIESKTDEEIKKAVWFMSELKDIAPVYAVSGNHDNWYSPDSVLSEEYEKIGISYLENETEVIEKDGEKIEIAGIKDPTISHYNPDLELDIFKGYIENMTPENFSILLFHRADMFDHIAGKGYNLVLSGHLHGGIVRIPFVGGVISPTRRLFPKYSGGKYEKGNTTLISNRGIAVLERTPRIFNRPEIVFITLNK